MFKREKASEKKDDFTTIKISKQYVVDFDKVRDFNDLKNIVQVLFVGLPIIINDNCSFIDDIKEYLVEVE